MIHRNFISGYILKKMYRNEGKCKLCKTIESKRTHIFMDCIITKQILDQFTDFLRAFVDIDIAHKEMVFGIFKYIK